MKFNFFRQPTPTNPPPTTPIPDPAPPAPAIRGTLRVPIRPFAHTEDSSTLAALRPPARCPKCADEIGFATCKPSFTSNSHKYAGALIWACETCHYSITTRTADEPDD